MKTTKILSTALILLASLLSINAQTSISFQTGFHSASTNFNGLSETLPITIDPILSLGAGITVEQALDPVLSLRTGIHYKRKGFSSRIGTDINLGDVAIPVGVKAVNTVNYIDIPLMLSYKPALKLRGIKPYVAAGPSIAYAHSGELRTKATAIIDFTVDRTPLNLNSDAYNRTEFMAQFAAGAEFPYRDGFISTELGYETALTDFTTDAMIVDAGTRHKGLNFKIGYGLRF